MTARQPIPNDAVLVAIDVAKARNEVLVEAAGHRRATQADSAQQPKRA